MRSYTTQSYYNRICFSIGHEEEAIKTLPLQSQPIKQKI